MLAVLEASFIIFVETPLLLYVGLSLLLLLNPRRICTIIASSNFPPTHRIVYIPKIHHWLVSNPRLAKEPEEIVSPASPNWLNIMVKRVAFIVMIHSALCLSVYTPNKANHALASSFFCLSGYWSSINKIWYYGITTSNLKPPKSTSTIIVQVPPSK